MTYDAKQAMTVALYNAGVRGCKDGVVREDMMPFELAEQTLHNLKSMGWLLDGYLHEERARLVERYALPDDGMCKHPECTNQAVDWGVCVTHLAEAMGGE